MLAVILVITTLCFSSWRDGSFSFVCSLLVFEQKAWLYGCWVEKINIDCPGFCVFKGAERVVLYEAEIWLLFVFGEEALRSCCVKPFPVWVSCDSGQGTGIGTKRASELHENFPPSLAAFALCAPLARHGCECRCTPENRAGIRTLALSLHFCVVFRRDTFWIRRRKGIVFKPTPCVCVC